MRRRPWPARLLAVKQTDRGTTDVVLIDPAGLSGRPGPCVGGVALVERIRIAVEGWCDRVGPHCRLVLRSVYDNDHACTLSAVDSHMQPPFAPRAPSPRAPTAEACVAPRPCARRPAIAGAADIRSVAPVHGSRPTSSPRAPGGSTHAFGRSPADVRLVIRPGVGSRRSSARATPPLPGGDRRRRGTCARCRLQPLDAPRAMSRTSAWRS